MSHSTQETANNAQALDLVAAFIRQRLVCDDHQLNILSLWSAYTWCFTSFINAPYLEIRSPEPQSGKSTCLMLLEAVCNSAVVLHGPAPATIIPRLIHGRSLDEIRNSKHPQVSLTILLDDCQHSFTLAERQPLISLLNCGSEAGFVYSHGADDYSVFGPKAFAGNTPLPSSLASRCIPIVLHRRKLSDPVKSYYSDDLEEASKNFRRWLQGWAEEHSERLLKNRNTPIQLPPGLTPRQQQCAEPLVRIANLMGGSWPKKAQMALTAVFAAADCTAQVQLLRDLRTLFFSKDKPEALPTRDLLAHLSTLENRPWSSWGSKSGSRLGSLLRPFHIFSADVRFGEDVLKGYRFKDFQDAWERYAGNVADCCATKNGSATA
jgi:Protein of unknown function (DUF3631)